MIEFPHHSKSHLNSKDCEMVSVLGTIHHHRHRWNPFARDNEMQRDAGRNQWYRNFYITPQGGRHGDGTYNLRFVINHNPARVLKAVDWKAGSQKQCELAETAWGEIGRNITFRTKVATECRIVVEDDLRFCSLTTVLPDCLELCCQEDSFELNGFVWDMEDMFGKFDERRTGRSFTRKSDRSWSIEVDLKKDGGIDFRSDGVYQFLISTNADEDQGLSALNRSSAIPLTSTSRKDWENAPKGNTIELVQGSGFGSSHGRALHSAPTISVSEDGVYRFVLTKSESGYQLKPEALGAGEIEIKNSINSMQLLGSVHSIDQFNPANPNSVMLPSSRSAGEYELELDVSAGIHVIAFALNNELFLDTMGLGCWLDQHDPDKSCLKGVGWHGKPNETNICFRVESQCRLRFSYDLNTDQFVIAEVGSRIGIHAVRGIESLSLVGNFADPMVSWDPTAIANQMNAVGAERFERYVLLKEGEEYNFKFVANRSEWQITFADYELDGYGSSLDEPNNSAPWDSNLQTLRRHGQLTTHGNPPALSFKASCSGWYRFLVDLQTGAYGVQRPNQVNRNA